ncbi:MAG: transporter [Candidatus Riflebacteria bacterium]|nr:transporter [Candidatus Riflebacteria bacterium]
MKRNTQVLALALLLSSGTVCAQNYLQPSTSSALRSAGFSDTFISRVKRAPVDSPKRQTVDDKGVYGAGDSLPPIPTSAAGGGGANSPDTGKKAGKSVKADVNSDSSGTDAGTSSSGTSDSGSGTSSGTNTGSDSNAKPDSGETPKVDDKSSGEKPASVAPATKSKKSKKSSSGSSKSSKKKSKKRRSSAPVVQSMPDSPAPVAETPSPLLPPPPAFGQGDQEIYSQEPVRLPPVGSLPMPSRTVLPPVSREAMMMDAAINETVSRVLACSFSGLTGLNTTVSADVSREGSFKMGFHSSWFQLDRVYNRVLASGESGDLLSLPLFFNYAVTNDLEFAFMMPIENYTIKSRILWSKDFRESGVGDSKLSFKYRVFDNGQYQMRGAFGLGFKFPTGSDAKGMGTGKTDFEVFTAFSKSFERIIAHLNLGYVMTGDPNTQFYPNGLADIFYYNIGLEYPHTNNVTVMAEVNGQDWGAEGLKVDITPSIRYTPTENFAFDMGVPIAVTNDQRYGYNYRLTFGVTAFFR